MDVGIMHWSMDILSVTMFNVNFQFCNEVKEFLGTVWTLLEKLNSEKT